MIEKAKEALEELKAQNQDLQDKFNTYVSYLQQELEIPEEIAVSLVTTELVNLNKKKLMLHALFSEKTLKENNIK